MEEKFGKKHPAMEGYREPAEPYMWLVDSFFRLHRRRQLGQSGYQPLAYQELADFAERVLKLGPLSESLYYRAMEETDNGVLYDHYAKQKSDLDEAKAKSKTKRSR
jgi:hypothetical protein